MQLRLMALFNDALHNLRGRITGLYGSCARSISARGFGPSSPFTVTLCC
jgi:hypothetical protein